MIITTFYKYFYLFQVKFGFQYETKIFSKTKKL